jgi:hypothetical protein
MSVGTVITAGEQAKCLAYCLAKCGALVLPLMLPLCCYYCCHCCCADGIAAADDIQCAVRHDGVLLELWRGGDRLLARVSCVFDVQ